MTVLYEDNHIIIVNKTASEIVQGDKTGDTPLSEIVKQYLKEKYAKPGNVFIGVTHRLDRPVSGLVVFAKTSKALSRLNEMFKGSEVKKTYWAVVKERPPKDEDELVHYLVRNEKQNKSYAYDTERSGSKKAILHYRLIELLPLGSRLKDGAPPSDPLPVGQDGMSHQGGFEIWFPPLQSRWQHQFARPPHTVHSSCLQGADRRGGTAAAR